MKLTQGCFSFLPDLTDDQITRQGQYCLPKGWAVNIEFPDDPHPRNTYWEMWGLPMFDLQDPAALLDEVRACRDEHPEHYVRVIAYDASLGRQTVAVSFLVNRPSEEPGFRLERQEGKDRQIAYTTHAYATDRPSGQRYGRHGSHGGARSNGDGRG